MHACTFNYHMTLASHVFRDVLQLSMRVENREYDWPKWLRVTIRTQMHPNMRLPTTDLSCLQLAFHLSFLLQLLPKFLPLEHCPAAAASF
jgi:hypothetical protein